MKKHHYRITTTFKMHQPNTKRSRYQMLCKFAQHSTPRKLLPFLYIFIIILLKNQKSHQTTPMNSSSQSETRYTPIPDKAYSLLLSTNKQQQQTEQQPFPEDQPGSDSSLSASRRILQDVSNHQMEDALENNHNHHQLGGDNRTYFRPPSASESIVEPVMPPLFSYLQRTKTGKTNSATPEPTDIQAASQVTTSHIDRFSQTNSSSSAEGTPDQEPHYFKPSDEYITNNWLQDTDSRPEKSPGTHRKEEAGRPVATRSMSAHLVAIQQQQPAKNRTRSSDLNPSLVDKSHKARETERINQPPSPHPTTADKFSNYQHVMVEAEHGKTGIGLTTRAPVITAFLAKAPQPSQIKGKYLQLSGLLPFARKSKKQLQLHHKGTSRPYFEDLQTSAQTADVSLGSRDVVMTPQMLQHMSQGMAANQQGSFANSVLEAQRMMKTTPMYQHYHMMNQPNKALTRPHQMADSIDPSASMFHQLAATQKNYQPRYESINAQLPSAQHAVINTRNTLDIGDNPSTASFTLLPGGEGQQDTMTMSDGGQLSGMDQDPMSVLRALGGLPAPTDTSAQDSSQNEALATMLETFLKNSIANNNNNNNNNGNGNNNNQKSPDNQQQSNNNNNNNGNNNNANNNGGNNQQQQPAQTTQQPQLQQQQAQITQQAPQQQPVASVPLPPPLPSPMASQPHLNLAAQASSLHLNPNKALSIGQQPGGFSMPPHSQMMMPSSSTEDPQQLYGSANPSEMSPEYYPYGPQHKKRKTKGKKRKNNAKAPPQIRVQKKPRVATGNPGFYDIDSQNDLQPSATFHRWKYPWLYAPGAFRPNGDDDEEEEGETEVNIRFFNNFSRMGPFGQLTRAGGTATLVVSLAFLIISNISLAATVIAHGISSFLRNAAPPDRNKTTSRKRETTATPAQVNQRALDIFLERTSSSTTTTTTTTTTSAPNNTTSLDEQIESLGKIWSE